MMYSQLLNDYSTLAQNYHTQSEANLELYQQLEALLQEKISLLQENNTSSQQTLPSARLLSQLSPREEVLEGPAPKGGSRRKTGKKRIKREINRCSSTGCHRDFRSNGSINLHVRGKHNESRRKAKPSAVV
jgi:hypothetical protein